MTINERVSPKRLAEIIARAEVCDDSVLTDYRDIESIARELQQYRAAAEKPIGSFHIIDQQVGGTTDYVKDGEWPIDNGELLVYAAPQVTSLPDGIEAAARWVDAQREAYDDEHGRYDPDTGTFEFGNDAQLEYSATLAEIAEGIRALRPTAAPAVQSEQLSGNTEQVSQPTLPADYLQGHKDGCEWAARMAEANHPQTGDWLFDDPIELAKAIRKGPDMLPVEPGNSPAIPDGYALVPVELMESLRSAAHFEKQSYAASFGSHIDTGRWKVEYEELERVCKETDRIMAAAPQPQNVQQNNPENIPQWIPVSERMPGSRHAVLVGRWFGREWTSKWATYVPGHPDAQDSGWLIPGASWTPTHWHELPAAPKQEAE